MTKKDKYTLVEQDGVVYEQSNSQFFSVFCRISGVILAVMGILLTVVTPPFGLISIVIGVLFFFKISKYKKSKIVSISSPLYTGGRTFGEWNEEVHNGVSQSDRFERATHQTMELISYNPKTGAGMVHSSSGNTYVTSLDFCSCKDFEKRSKPCKHIYFLAIKMGYTHDDFYN